jgi:hypothetical protein
MDGIPQHVDLASRRLLPVVAVNLLQCMEWQAFHKYTVYGSIPMAHGLDEADGSDRVGSSALVLAWVGRVEQVDSLEPAGQWGQADWSD